MRPSHLHEKRPPLFGILSAMITERHSRMRAEIAGTPAAIIETVSWASACTSLVRSMNGLDHRVGDLLGRRIAADIGG